MARILPFVRPRWRIRTRLLGMFGLAALLVVAGGALALRQLPAEIAVARPAMVSGFVALDGDTIEHRGRRIRLADIDAPELFSPQCASERALAERARLRLAALLAEGPVTLEPQGRDIDQYGRQLRIVARDGHSLGAVLVAEGLAREWDGVRHPWC
jgi:hypothetical protein